jgi:NRAMP (natural resistance-associated macrophage protein)-like metal ion transporter
MLFFAILGPGIITANADNDATGILGYSQAGAQYQYGMLWVLVLSTFSLGVAQEICARMGAVTGKGLADLIREEYGVRITILAMAALLVANFATTVAEFAGILAAVQVFAAPWVRFVVIPITAIGVWMLVTRGSYRRFEVVLLWASFIYLAYVASAFLAHPPWGQVLKETVVPDLTRFKPLQSYIFMVINVVGTTITPWGQFYVQSAVRDKGIREEQYGYTRLDVLFGSFFTNFIAFFIVVCCGATLYSHGIHDLSNPGQAAAALAPIAGTLASALFAIGLFNASCFGAIVVPLSTAYAVTEALGWESGVGRRTRQAPLFIWVYTLLIAAAGATVLIFPNNLTFLIILPNIIGGVLLPITLVLMLLLVNKPRLMGHAVNSRTYNAIAWSTTVVITLLSVTLLVTSIVGGG